MKKRILSILLTLCMLLSLIPMTVSAADAPVDAPLALTYIGTNCTTDSADGNAKMLLDGKVDTKWCTNHALPLTISFRTDGKTVVKSMELYSANDTSNSRWAGRNWKAWSLYGWDAASADWVEIQSWSDEKPQTTYGQCSTYAITNDTAYDKYQLEISANWGGDEYGLTAQMAEMKLIGHKENETTYTVTYNSNGGSTVSPATGRTTLPTLPVPTKSGFEFVGWYTDEALTKVARAGDAISQDTTLYARWGNKTSSLALTYITSNDDSLTTCGPRDLIDGTYNDSQNKWCTRHALPLTLEFSTATYTVVKSMELYAATDTCIERWAGRNWKAWSLYGLDSTGDWVEIQSWSNQKPGTDPEKCTTYAISNNTSYEKYQLVISANWGGCDKYITAQMAEMKLNGYNQSYAITYELNGGTNGNNPATYTYGTGVTSFASATRDGYIFDGWYDAAEGGNKITTVSSTATGDKTLYARWSRDYGTDATYYKAYDVVVSKDGISFKFLLDQLGHNGNGNADYTFVRCDMQLRTGNSSTNPLTAFPDNMIDYTKPSKDEDPVGFVKTNATPTQATMDIDRTENVVSITIKPESINISGLLTAETPYVWLYIRPCWWNTAYDNSTTQGIAYYNDIVYLGKYSSNENFQNGIEECAGTVTIDSGITNGTVSVTKATKFEGEKVVLNVTPDTGYLVDTVTYTPAGGKATAVTKAGSEYSFTMPNSDVTVNATFISNTYVVKVVKSDSTTSYYTSLSDAIGNSESGDTVVMLANSVGNITIPSDKDITLDLNGFTFTTDNADSAITNNGTLTLKDSSNDKTGTITGTATVTNGGVYNAGVLNMEGGNITGFTAENRDIGAGVYNAGTFNMSGGTISDNHATALPNGGVNVQAAGAVYNSGAFNMTGGTIKNCSSLGSASAGAILSKRGTNASVSITGTAEIINNTSYDPNNSIVYCGNTGGIFHISNGALVIGGSAKITGNKGRCSGGVYAQYSTIKISGSPTITGNTITSGTEEPCDVNATDVNIQITDALTGADGSIGIFIYTYIGAGRTAPTSSNPVVFTTQNGGAYASKFFSDITSYRIGTNGTEAIVAVPSTITVSGILNATVTADKTNAAIGEKVVLTVTPDTGFTLDTITYTPAGGTATAITQTDGVYSFTMPNSNVTVNATFVSDVKVVKTNGTTSYYASLSDAISNSENGDTVVMLANTNENITIAQGQTITLDLNGFVLKGDGTSSVITNNGTLTIKDSGTTAVHKYVVGSDGLWTWNDDADGTATAFENLTARPATNDVIAVKGGAITGGVATNGGGIYSTGSLTLNGVNVIGNKSNGTTQDSYGHDNGGGGVYSKSSLIVTESKIAGNITAVSGGGIYSEGTLDIDKSYIVNNKSDVNNGEHGGGGLFIYTGTVTIDDSFIDANSGRAYGTIASAAGAAMFIVNGTVTVNNTSICNNINAGEGAAMRVRPYDGHGTATATFNNCNISNNEACRWGAAVNSSNDVTLSFINCVFEHNTLTGGNTAGNVISINIRSLLLDGCTMTNNSKGCSVIDIMNIKNMSVAVIKDTTITGNTFSNDSWSAGEPGTAVVFRGVSLTLKGKVIITDNTRANGTESNLYLPSGKKVTIDTTTPLVNGSDIGVTTAVLPTLTSPVQITTNGKNTDLEYFFSDNDAYTDNYNDKGYLMLVAEIPEAVKDAEYYASLTLNENIDVNFALSNIPNANSEKLSITVDGTVREFVLKDGTAECVLKAVEPKDIGKDIHIVVAYNGITVKDFNYSIINYCNAVYNTQGYGKDSKLGKLCTAILNYGKYAEDYANEQALADGKIQTLPDASTVNAGHEIDFSTVELPKSNMKFVDSPTFGAKGSGAYLTLDSTIKLNFLVLVNDFEYELILVKGMDNAAAIAQGKYKADSTPFAQNFYILNNNNKQIDPAKVSVSAVKGGYIISVDLYAYQLSNQYTLKVKNVETKEFCITCGVNDYCAEVQSMTGEEYSDTLKTLCKAIYNYSQAILAYSAQ